MGSIPLTPHWQQPSHPDVQKVVFPSTSSSSDFSTKSYSTVSIAPGGLYAEIGYPPCTVSKVGATYATVQTGREKHTELNCDFLYVEHSCDPSLVFSPTATNIRLYASSKGLSPGDELTFFYPSTEWDMAQGFNCHCGSKLCLGFVQGAKHLTRAQLEGTGDVKRWISEHVRELVGERDGVKWEVASMDGGKSDVQQQAR